MSQSFIKVHLFSFDSVSFLFVSVTQTERARYSSRRFEEKLQPQNEASGIFGRRLKVRLLPAVVVENHFWRVEIKLAADLKAVLCRSRRLWLFISTPLVSKRVIRPHRRVFREPFCSVFSGDESYSAQPRPLLAPPPTLS